MSTEWVGGQKKTKKFVNVVCEQPFAWKCSAIKNDLLTPQYPHGLSEAKGWLYFILVKSNFTPFIKALGLTNHLSMSIDEILAHKSCFNVFVGHEKPLRKPL